MGWKRLDVLSGRQFAARGMGARVAAGLICTKAEELYPDLVQAISIKNGVLTLYVPLALQLEFHLIEGTLVKELNTYAAEAKLPNVTRVRLTNHPPSPIL